MALTPFGVAVRDARRQTKQTLQSMAKSLGTSAAFLSAMETGKSKVPLNYIAKIEQFFQSKGYPAHTLCLTQKAQISNESVSLDGLSLQHKMLIAGFASSDFNKEQLDRFARLLSDIQGELKEVSDG